MRIYSSNYTEQVITQENDKKERVTNRKRYAGVTINIISLG